VTVRLADLPPKARAAAERALAAEQRAAAAPSGPENPAALEKQTQADVVRLFRAFGGVVYSLSQPRATKQAPGLPDLYVFFPRRRVALWWETKRPTGGRLSPAQEEFRDFCHHTGTPWGSGSRVDAEAWLVKAGLAYRAADGTLEPDRSESPT
jgi:hypothetical protein